MEDHQHTHTHTPAHPPTRPAVVRVVVTSPAAPSGIQVDPAVLFSLPLQTISAVLQDFELEIRGEDDLFFSRAVDTVIKHHPSDVRYLKLEGIKPTSAGQVFQQMPSATTW